MKSSVDNKQADEYVLKIRNHFRICNDNNMQKMCSELLKINTNFLKDSKVDTNNIVLLFKEAAKCMMANRENTNQLTCAKI